MEDQSAFGVGSVDGYGKQAQQGQNLGEENPTDGSNTKDPFYTMPGVLHFLQTEWSKFEMERSQWEVERAELQARIAFLQGERKGQENLKHDLVRRIKMLEFALRQERAKFHRLKFGSEPPGGAAIAAATAGDATDGDSGASPAVSQLLDPEELLRETSTQTAATKAKAKDGRQLIRQYLQEIGYVDTILDARQARLQQLIGASGTTASAAAPVAAAATVSSASNDSKPPTSQQQQPPPPPSHQQHQQQQQPQQMRQITSRSQQQPQQRGRSIQEQLSSLIPGINIAGDDEDDDEDDDADDADVDVGVGGSGRLVRGGGKTALSEEDQAMATFDFVLDQQDSDIQQPAEDSKDSAAAAVAGGEDGAGGVDEDAEWNLDERTRSKMEAFKKERIRGSKKSTGSAGGGSGGGRVGMLDAFLDGFDRGEEGGTVDDFDGVTPSSAAAAAVAASEEEGFRSAMGLSLGDLQNIDVTNERDYDDDVGISAGGSASARRTWASKFNLRSHLDSVRSLAFHPTDSALLTASEDGTMKLWNLSGRAVHQEAGSPTSAGSDSQRSAGGTAGPQVELEPVHTYRGHAGPVLTVCVSPDGGLACTGGLDGCVRVWRLPPSLSGLDQYDAFDASLVGEALEGHQDAVWSLAAMGPDTVFSIGADSTLRAWRTRHHGNQQGDDESGSSSPLLRTSELPGRPTSLAIVPADPGKLLVSMATVADSAGSCLLLVDAETGQTVLRMPTSSAGEGEGAAASATRVVAHPTQATAMAGYSDRCIRCYDYASGELTHSMVAHLDSVTSLAVDPNGLYLVSGSHDASLRVWSLDDPRSCVQEIAAHRRKFDEAVHDVALHPAKSLLASAGADALAKVFV
ncbi:hypothetical protein BOX15_Mlig031478g1 [Macrostomum lignano]|uniref:Striatin N-terminal domain-containing protein n=1 Tax=Macrostomum lignano TaxID=282301 RepID=A0A267F1S1_9PLAT|nr:hypothetical protein BOX15_Mlig031478g1 [Macrostomum lignano]